MYGRVDNSFAFAFDLVVFLSDTFINSIMVCLSGLLAMLFSSYVIGLVSNERKFIKDKILLF